MNLKDTLKQAAKKGIVEYDKAKHKTKKFIEETRKEEHLKQQYEDIKKHGSQNEKHYN